MSYSSSAERRAPAPAAPPAPAGWGQHQLVLLIAACFTLGVGAISWPVLCDAGFPLDDSWIHQVVGRNTATYGIPGFIPGMVSAGSTSTVWPWIIALNYRLLPGVSPVIYLLVLNAGLLALALALLFAAARRDSLPPLEMALVAGLPALTGNLMWLVSTGMEHMLFIVATLGAAHFWLRPQTQDGAAFKAGACCALAIVTRPEGALFVPFFLLFARVAGRSRRECLHFGLICCAGLLIVLLNNEWTSHSLVPVTYSGRKWLVLVLAGHAQATPTWRWASSDPGSQGRPATCWASRQWDWRAV